MEDKKFQHPEGKIQLLNGRVLDCCPLEQPQDEVDNQLSLDTTGVYLSLKKPNKANTVKIEKKMKRSWRNCFLTMLSFSWRTGSKSCQTVECFYVLCLFAGVGLLTQAQVVSVILLWEYSLSFGWLVR